ncbi:hypothetical protein CI102_8594 [Trichoderma harzianum]|nr:hypothetical protein CI102_8594 [Trichoderma harzianum]
MDKSDGHLQGQIAVKPAGEMRDTMHAEHRDLIQFDPARLDSPPACQWFPCCCGCKGRLCSTSTSSISYVCAYVFSTAGQSCARLSLFRYPIVQNQAQAEYRPETSGNRRGAQKHRRSKTQMVVRYKYDDTSTEQSSRATASVASTIQKTSQTRSHRRSGRITSPEKTDMQSTDGELFKCARTTMQSSRYLAKGRTQSVGMRLYHGAGGCSIRYIIR